MKTPNRQRGIALISALLVVAVATVAAVEMARRQQIDIRRMQGLMAFDQAYTYAIAAESWALDTLKQDLEDNNTDALDDTWAQPVSVPGYQGAQLTLIIEDLQSRFNLNNLASVPPQNPDSDPHYQRFRRLIENVVEENPDIQANAEEIANSLADWLDEDLNPRFPGAEDGLYLSANQERPAYRAANQRMESPSELMLVHGVTPELYDALRPYVTALPDTTALNVNTATPQTLRLIHPSLTLEQAERIIENERPEEGWEELNQLLALGPLAGQSISDSQDELGLSSGFFAVHATVTLGEAQVTLHSLVRRHANGRMQVLQRGLGTL